MNNGQLFELPDEVPYKRIQELQIFDVKYIPQTSIFQLYIYKKCEDMPDEEQGYRIQRKLADFQWLIARIQKQSRRNIVLPNIQMTGGGYWEMIKNAAESFKKTEKTEPKKKIEHQFYERIAKRFLEILGEVSLKYIYTNPGNFQSCLFTFLDKKYEIYQSDVFQPDEENLSDKVTNNIGYITNYLVGYFKKKDEELLKKQIEEISRLQKQFLVFSNELKDYEHSLENLGTNFLKDKKDLEIKNKDFKIFNILCRSEFILKFINNLKFQMDSVMRKKQEKMKLSYDEAEIKQQIDLYLNYIAKDKKYLNKQIKQLLEQFYKVTTIQEIVIDINDIYVGK